MQTAMRALLVALLYLAAARYAVLLQDLEGLGAVFWPGAGVTVTGLLVSPRRMWPAILIAVGATEFVHDLLLGYGPTASGLWTAANVVVGLLATWLLQRWDAAGFDRVRSIGLFIVAALAASAIGGAIGALGTAGAVGSLPYPVVVGQWMVGDGLGILTVVPFGLLLTGRIPTAPLRSVEGVAATLSVLLVSLLVFGVTDHAVLFAGDYLVLLPLVWAAVRVGVAGAAIAVFIVAQLGNGLHAFGRGPFAAEHLSSVQGSAQLQLFLAAVAITALLLACRTVESATYRDLAATREQLISAVSHELRTPLTPIVGFTELLLRHGPASDPLSRQGLGVIQRNGQHLTSMVDDLLNASRARRGVVPVAPHSVALAPFIDRLLTSRQMEPIELDVAPDLEVWVDPTHLTQVITNLLDNARRYGRPPVVITAHRDGDSVEVAVRDHGEGVPDWFVPELFEEFAQAKTEDTRPSQGLGLGLPIARSLLRANGGDLTYRTTDGGACFVLTLPAADAVEAANPEHSLNAR